MDIHTLPIKEAVVSPNTEKKQEERGSIYWFEREDGVFIPTKEKEAWNIFKGRIRINSQPVKFKYLGMSSGQLYWSEMKRVPEVFSTDGETKAREFIKDVEKRERESANPLIKPRNFDGMDLSGQPVNLNTGGLI